MSTAIQIGNVVRSTVTFTPASGSVELADVSCRLSKAHRSEVAVSGIVDAGSGSFYVDVETTESDPPGLWVFRWESSSPSPRIVIEDETTRFVLTPTSFTSP